MHFVGFVIEIYFYDTFVVSLCEILETAVEIWCVTEVSDPKLTRSNHTYYSLPSILTVP
jgi:hypothetical protein